MPYMSYDYHEVEDMEFEELLRQRYATKVFDGRKVEDKKLDSILEMIRLTPSAINLQPWKIKVVREDRTKQALSPCSLGQKQITTCSDLLVFCADTDLHGHALKVLEGMRAAGVPQEDISDMEGFLHGNIGQLTPEQRLAEAQKNVYLAAMTAIYAAKSLGVDSCPMAGFDPACYAKVLKLPANLVPTMLVPIGYPADKPMPKVRFPKEDIFF